MQAKRAGKIIKLTTFQAIKRGSWMMRFSCTDMGSILLFARSLLAPDNTFIRFFVDEAEAAAFADYLSHQDFYDPDFGLYDGS